MKAIAILTNFFVPGVGSFFVGKVGQGIAQILLWGLGFLLTVGTMGIGGVIGIPLMFGAWIWGLITASSANPKPIQVNVVDQRTDAGSGK